MTTSRKILGVIALTSLVACSHAEFRPRAIGGAAAVDNSPGHNLAEANMQFQLGNFALAITHYRKAIRDAPDSVEAIRGLAACYERLGRSDLSQRYYAQAAAMVPQSGAAASGVADAQSGSASAPEPVQVAAERSASITIPVPPAPIAPLAAAPAAAGSRAFENRTPSPPAAPMPVRPVAAGSGVIANRILPVTVAPPSSSDYGARITIALPPAEAAPRDGARLERISAGEVALVTRPAPRPAPSRVAGVGRVLPGQAQPTTLERSTGARLELRLDPPAREQAPQATAVRILNGVGRRGQAARMEQHLRSNGWRNVTVGDAAIRRAATIIVYTQGTAREARLLARRLPFRTQMTLAGGPRRLLLVLGRNSSAFDTRLQSGRSRL